jgi:hypothetical protein
MATKPNFTDVKLMGNTVRVEGESPSEKPEDVADLVGIQVVLAQDGRTAGGPVDELTEVWHANLDVNPGDFRVGPAVVFGVETRRENFTTVTWSEPVEIHE